MKQTRREFAVHLAAGSLALGGLATIEGCSVSSVFTDILNWLPVGEAALQSVLTVLSANGFAISPAAAAIVALIEGGFNQATADVKLYESIKPAPVGALASIQAAFGVISSNYQAFLTAIDVPVSPLLQTIEALAQVALSTVAAFVAMLPAPTAAAAPASKLSTYQVGRNAPMTVTAVHRTRRAFKKAHNSVLNAGKSAKLDIPQSAYLPLSLMEHL